MSSNYTRNIVATLHRRVGESNRTQVLWTRHYARVENALRRATELFYLEGQVGDVLEFALTTNGMQLGTIKMHTEGRLVTQWIKPEAV